MRKKIVCLGGASRNFSKMYADIILTDGLEGSEIVIYDIDRERSSLMCDYVKKLNDIAGSNFRIKVSKNISDAVEGADFAIFDIGGIGGGGGGFYRPGGLHMKDLLISAKYGIYQIIGDTAGPAAMMAAFRSIPIFLKICSEMEKRCPDVVIINHANPMAILCRAMNKYTKLKSIIGICHGVQGGIRYVSEILGVEPSELDTVWIGTNHYYWFTKIYHKGKDVYDKLLKKMEKLKPSDNYLFHSDLTKIFGYQIVYPDDNHIIEFYPYLSQVRNSAEIPYKLSSSHHGKQVKKMYKNLEMKKRKKEKGLKREYILEVNLNWKV